MPAKIQMTLSDPSHRTRQIMNALTNNIIKTSQTSIKPSALNASMISRIHNVRPGCGSCGK